MPVHNAGRYLQQAVSSILAQQEVLFELVIVDDNSTDNAIQSLPKDKRINLIESTGHGIVHALNLGIATAAYPFIARMDADDIAHPLRLIKQLDYLHSNPQVDICGCKVQMFSDSTIGKGYQLYQDWLNAQCSHQQIIDNFFVESPIPHPSALFRKSLIDEIGAYKDSRWPEDYDLWCRALLANKVFGKPENDKLLKWRDHPKRLSRTDQRYNKQMFLRCKAFYLSQILLGRALHSENKPKHVIWGTGPTGLKLHDYLQEFGLPIDSFIDVNPKMHDRKKRNKTIKLVNSSLKNSADTIDPRYFCDTVVIVAVSARGARTEIDSFLRSTGLRVGIDYVLAA